MLDALSFLDRTPASRRNASSDFGRVCSADPLGVARPCNAEELASLFRAAAAEGIRCTVRGAGHSQNGLALGDGIVVDCSAMQALRIEDGVAIAGAGTRWSDVVDAATARGWIPPVLTDNLGVTIGGTIAVGGLGPASQRHGVQAAHCRSFEIVTPDGETLHCSRDGNAELFRMARCGLGQFGVMTSIALSLRECRGFVSATTRTFASAREGLAALRDAGDADFVECWSRNCGSASEWRVELTLGRETNRAGMPVRELAHRYSAGFQRPSNPALAHPWTEAFLPWDAAPELLREIGARAPGATLLLWPVRRPAELPMLRLPERGDVLFVGLLPEVPGEQLGAVLLSLRAISAAARALGGTRYLSGFTGYSDAEWREHFGEVWERFRTLKLRHDPLGVIAPLGTQRTVAPG